MDVYDRLGIRSKELLMGHKEILKTSAQNMDVLYFYNITNLKKGKKIRKFGRYFHGNNVYNFFSTLINYIKYNGYQYNPDVMAFLYGMLSHYVLDSTMHPYVTYKTGLFKKEDKNTYKYNHLHADLEAYFDNYLIRLKENIVPHKFKCYQYCFNVERLDKDLIEVMDFTYKEVFGISNFHEYYLKSIKQMNFFFKVFRYDPTGIKKSFYQRLFKLFHQVVCDFSFSHADVRADFSFCIQELMHYFAYRFCCYCVAYAVAFLYWCSWHATVTCAFFRNTFFVSGRFRIFNY
jgi:hypothetical protein